MEGKITYRSIYGGIKSACYFACMDAVGTWMSKVLGLALLSTMHLIIGDDVKNQLP